MINMNMNMKYDIWKIDHESYGTRNMNICMPVYHENQLKGSQAQDVIVIFPIFLASFNNRQG